MLFIWEVLLVKRGFDNLEVFGRFRAIHGRNVEHTRARVNFFAQSLFITAISFPIYRGLFQTRFRPSNQSHLCTLYLDLSPINMISLLSSLFVFQKFSFNYSTNTSKQLFKLPKQKSVIHNFLSTLRWLWQ